MTATADGYLDASWIDDTPALTIDKTINLK